MNTVTTKDVAETAMRPKRAYDYFGSEWAVSSDGEGMNPVAQFGLGAVRTSRRAQGFGGLGAVRTSRRAQGFGGLGEGIMDTLQSKPFLGIPMWALLAGGAFLAMGGLKKLGIGK
jgi:hypothetical protein